MGDVGYVDEEGYLYLTDRKTFMIISGGVNIYPQAIEDALVTHEKVGDVAVIGVPCAEMGEQVKAIIEPAPRHRAQRGARRGVDRLPAREGGAVHDSALGGFHRPHAPVPTGKLYKQALRGRCRTGP